VSRWPTPGQGSMKTVIQQVHVPLPLKANRRRTVGTPVRPSAWPLPITTSALHRAADMRGALSQARRGAPPAAAAPRLATLKMSTKYSDPDQIPCDAGSQPDRDARRPSRPASYPTAPMWKLLTDPRTFGTDTAYPEPERAIQLTPVIVCGRRPIGPMSQTVGPCPISQWPAHVGIHQKDPVLGH